MVSVFERMSKRKPSAARLLAVAAAFAPGTATVAAGTTVAATASVVVVTSAVAGEYHVYSCRTPAGESAPADGWSRSEAGPEAFADDTCSQPGGALIAALRAGTARTANVDSATWAFEAPAGETLAGATLWRAGDADGGAAPSAFYEFWFAGPDNLNEPATAFGQCVEGSTCPEGRGTMSQPQSAANRLEVPGPNLGPHLYVNASCAGATGFKCGEGEHDPNGYAAVVYLYAADLTLEQATSPTASNVSGELASAATVAGTSDVAFDASDPGSGVYEAVFTVDGEVVQRTVVDEDEGRCRNVGQTTDGLPAFLYVQPCPASVSADVGFDTTVVANGVHHLVVSVIDAAGNAATVLDRNVTIDNPPAPGSALGPSEPGGPNGRNASSRATLTVGWSNTASARLVSDYGRVHTIVGRLSAADGAPIEAAQVNVRSTLDYAGAPTASLPSVSTGVGGRFVLRLPPGVSSRTLRFAYSDRRDAPPVVTRMLTLSVRAGVNLVIAPRTASVGRSIYFSGRLPGGPVPSGGKLLVLEARSPGGAWLEFDVIRSDARGRFHASYRFKFAGPAEYQFRVLCEAEADYPFATGASNAVGVFER
jgi:hypothetical protein